MDLKADNFYETLDKFQVLPDWITSVEEAVFKQVYGRDAAAIEKNILYVLRTDLQIPKLRGKSDVVYIGQTKGTLKQRYLVHSGKFANSIANRMKFEHIVSHYGPIRITFAPFGQYGKNLALAEVQLLWWYFQNHCEYPPVNYTQTKMRNPCVSLV